MKTKKKQSRLLKDLSKHGVAKTLAMYKIYVILIIAIIFIIGLVFLKITYVAAGQISVPGPNAGCSSSSIIGQSEAQSFINAYINGGSYTIQYSVFCAESDDYDMKTTITASRDHIKNNSYGDADASYGGYFSPSCDLEIQSKYYVVHCPNTGVQNVQIYYKSKL